MSENLFDNFLKEKLQNHASPVAEGMWERIHSRREKERRIGFWWNNYRGLGYGLVGVVLLATIFVAREVSDHSFGVSEKDTRQSQQQSSSNPQKDNATNNAYLPNNNGNSNQQTKDEASLKKEDAIQSPSNTSNPDRQNALAKADQPITSKAGKTTLLQNANAVPQTSKVADNAGGILKSKNKRNNLAAIGLQSPGLGLQKEDSEAYQATNPGEKEYLNINALKFLANKNSATSIHLNKNLGKLRGITLTDCPSAFGNRSSNWYIEAFASPDYTMKRTNTNLLNEEYLRRKDSTESYNGAFTAGIRVSKTFGNHMLVKTGLQYSQINEKFNYQAENERRLVTVVTIRTIIRGNNPGDTLTVRDTSIVEQIGYRVKTTHNRYSSFDVPVILGYEWGNDDWRGSINAGVIFNVRSWQQGDVLDTSYQPLSFDKSSPVFKHNIGIGLYAGVSLIKPVADRWDVFAEPYLRYNISNMTSSNSPFNQKFNIIGINFGVRYKIAGNRQQ